MSKHSASGSFAGYLFQIDRLLFWLSKSDVQVVSLETEDDIVAEFKEIKGYSKLLEQAKHTQSNSPPYTDKSVDLWKTLSIWLSGIESESDLSGMNFSLVSNKKMPTKRLIYKIVESKLEEEKFKEYVDELLAIAENPSETIKEYAVIVFSKSRSILEGLLKKVLIVKEDDPVDPKKIKEQIRSNLGIGERLPIDLIFRGIRGFLLDLIMQRWSHGNEFSIERDLLLEETNRLIVKYHDKSFIENTIDSLPLTSNQIESERRSTYVEQLSEVGASEREVIKSIRNFLRAEIEKTRLAREGTVLKSSYDNYYEQLKSKWESVFDHKVGVSEGQSDIKIGLDIYYSTKDYKGKLNDQEPLQEYTYQGAYHFLSNELEIGWHPKWENIFKSVEV